jgi:hypothetical protein
MKKAIAMKCNEQQFESIREKLVGFDLSEIDLTDNFYLINNFLGEDNHLATMHGKGSENRKIYETWDEEIFLEACEIKSIKYEVFLWNEWNDIQHPVRIKPTYTKEIEHIEQLAKEIGFKVTLEKL